MMNMIRLSLVSVLFFLSFSTFADIKVISWNVESGGATLSTFSRHFEDMDEIDFYGLSEVKADWESGILRNISADENINYRSILGTTGGADRLQIIYNADRYHLVDNDELDDINIQGRVRAPLIGIFEEKATNKRLIVMVNHLYRSNENARHQQATLLNRWAAAQPLPVIAMGDYNFDWHVENGDQDHDEGFDNFTSGGVFKWIKPASLVRTQCNLNYNSVLDFIFVSGALKSVESTSDILLNHPAYCTTDIRNEADHRPIFASIGDEESGDDDETVISRQQLLNHVAAIERELTALKNVIEQMSN